MKVSVVLLLLAVVAVSAHDWLVIPTPRMTGSQPATQQCAPCDPVRSDSPPPTLITRNKVFTIEWGNNHKTGNYNFYLAKKGNDSVLADFKLIVGPVAADQNQPETTTYTFSQALGNYTFRYNWDSYCNCADIILTDPAPTGATAANGSVKSPIDNTILQQGYYLLKSDDGTPVGVFNSYTGTANCVSGYHASGNACVEGSSAASTAVLSAALFAVAAVGVILA
eukprot:TRINITY_DN556_c0_g1_i1.p1 TRINITY_DN556_c0_g1~~TRINITY_DN556_c0_g1_i1.p1  ORF type:complete len:224 (-),score=58.23 TRINITY_DN556_c0_g1_i1:290-961(-)